MQENWKEKGQKFGLEKMEERSGSKRSKRGWEGRMGKDNFGTVMEKRKLGIEQVLSSVC